MIGKKAKNIVLRNEEEMEMQSGNIRGRKVYIFALTITLLLTGIFLNSFHWPSDGVNARKMFVVIIAILSVFVIPILAVKLKIFRQVVEKTMAKGMNALRSVWNSKKRILLIMGAILCSFGAIWLLVGIISRFVLKTGYNTRLFFLCITFAVLSVGVVRFWKKAEKKIENLFAILAVVLGVFCICVTPSRTGVAWDDEIHYMRTLAITNRINGIMYAADEKNIEDHVENLVNRIGYDRKTDSEYSEELEKLYSEKICTEYEFSQYGIWSICYIPASIGIILGRGLGLTYAGVFNMGRIFNLLMYVALIYMAVKRIKYGKVLVSAIGMIPVNVFMASSYSYDPWVTGFTILGLAYFFAELQEDAPLQTKNLLIMTGAIALGCIPKAIYFPILLPLLLMPKNKFKNDKQRRYCYMLCVCAGIFLVSTFLLPIFISGVGTGDPRGGTDVNSTEQVKFILNNPLQYLKILFNFELDYLSMGVAGVMTQGFGYSGIGRFGGVVWLVLFVLAFLDRGEDEKNYVMVKCAGLLGCVMTILLATTALYISYTAVASNTVAGMQGRYIIPVIYPTLYSLGFGGTTHKIDKRIFASVPLIILAFTLLYNMGQICVLYY